METPPSFLSFHGLKFIQHPLINDYETEVYRGIGGYMYRWNIRKTRQVLSRKVYIIGADFGFGPDKTVIMSPESMVMIKNLV